MQEIVRVQSQHVPPAGLADAPVGGPSEAVVPSVREDPNPRVVPEPVQDLLRVVRRPVVEDDQFPVREHLRADALDGVRQKAAVVVAEEVDRDRRRHESLARSSQELNEAFTSRSGSRRVSHFVDFCR